MAGPQILKHMMPRDIPLFASYVLTPEGMGYTGWEFDVLVGAPADPGAHFPDNQRRAALYINALKIDAVGWLYNTPRLIECKPDAGCGALGQILGYQRWYSIIFGHEPAMMIICRRMSAQVEHLCNLWDIEVKKVLPASDFDVERAIAYVRDRRVNRSILPDYLSLQ
jgi:hypothetical protein